MKRVLITGHRGFAGSHFCSALFDTYEVHGVDITDGVDVRDFFRTNDVRYDLVIHLAAVVGGRAKIEGEPLKVAVDLAIDAEMFGWALRTKPGRIVYYSSSAAYPTMLQTGDYHDRHAGSVRDRVRRLTLGSRLSESDLALDGSPIGQPDLTYGWAKLTGEMLAQHAEAEGLKAHVFRPFSGYGTDQDPSYPFRAFIDRALRRDDPFDIWGDGSAVRDWIHIDDIVAATMAAVEQDAPGPINLCTGIGTSFAELAKLVTTEAGYSPAYRHLTAQPTGVQYRVGDATRMHAYYQPKVTLQEGVRRALRGD